MDKTIEIYFGQYMSRNKYDFSDIYGQMLTGSDSTFIGIAQAMNKRGWQTTIFTDCKEEMNWDGVQVRHYSKFRETRKPPSVFYSFCEPSALKFVPAKSLRLVNLQLGDMDYVDPEDFKNVDCFVALSNHHRKHMQKIIPSIADRWEVVGNGFDPKLFEGKREKVKGSAMWASSADRGLHLLLSRVSQIKKAVPDFLLHVYYDFDNFLKWSDSINDNAPNYLREIKNRGKYVRYALSNLDADSIALHKGVSKREIAKAFDRTEVLPFFCDTVKETETFANTNCEACYCGTLPITSDADCLGDVYGNAGYPMVKGSAYKNLDELTDLTIRALKDQKWADGMREKTRAFAQNFTFDKQAEKLEHLIEKKWKELK